MPQYLRRLPFPQQNHTTSGSKMVIMITANSCLRHILDLVRVHSHQSFHRDPGDVSRWLFEGQCYHRWYGILDFIWKFEQNQILQYLSQSHLLYLYKFCRYLTIIGQYIPISFGKLGSDHTVPSLLSFIMLTSQLPVNHPVALWNPLCQGTMESPFPTLPW